MRIAPATWWAAIVALGLFELGVAGLALRPRVTPEYRAYFIDKTSDCWPHTTSGAYTLGQTLSFVDGKGVSFVPNKICGWFYPGADGTWSYGRFSVLRLVFPPGSAALTLTMTAGAMVEKARPLQRVVVSTNGQPLCTLAFDSATPETKTLAVPAALTATGRIELRFDYPDAGPGTELGPNGDAHLRAIRMVALTLTAAEK